MNTTVGRLLTFFIGVPLVVTIVVFPWMNHILLHILMVTVTFLAALEMQNILSKKMQTQNHYVVASMAALLPLVTALCIQFSVARSNTVILLTGVLELIIAFCIEVFPYGESADSSSPFSPALERTSSTVITVFYCGLLMSFLSRITEWEYATQALVFMILLVFGNDSFAWFFGVLFGKSTQGVFKVSPKKSVVGFLGGFFSCLAIAFLYWNFVPAYHVFKVWQVLIIGAVCSLTAIFGDLVESVFKRSSGIKDSGAIIPGRGGILDSIDSILFTAPVFYLISTLLFN